MEVDPQLKYIGIHTWKNLNFQFDVHIALQTVVKVHRLDDGCLAYSNQMRSLKHVQVVAHFIRYILLARGATPMGRKTCLLSQVLVTFYKDQVTLEHCSPSYQSKI